MVMTHSGLPLEWIALVLGLCFLSALYLIFFTQLQTPSSRRYSLSKLPLVGRLLKVISRTPYLLFTLKLITSFLFLLIIVAGLSGSQLAERNIATVFTWNLWWAGIVFAVLFFGTGWCAICPWDALATWLVKGKTWARTLEKSIFSNQLNLTVPHWLRNVWTATFMLCAFTWFELGAGASVSPYVTAQLALLMLVLATTSLALFERKAFCRYFCPVGRTVGAYAQLSAVELRIDDEDICEKCTTLECYHGNETIEPCPSKLTIGKLKESTYCTSCGNCALSCPSDNVMWRARPISVEAIHNARPHLDESFFMLTLLAITLFHGLTMLPLWENLISILAQTLNDSSNLLFTFSVAMTGFIAVFLVLYYGFIALQYKLISGISDNVIVRTSDTQSLDTQSFKKLFTSLAFAALPLSFTYHLAHNLNHLARENSDLKSIVMNPFGEGTLPLSMMEKHLRHESMWLSQDVLFALQSGLMFVGFWIAIRVVVQRSNYLFGIGGLRLLPTVSFVFTVFGFCLWMLSQDMVMRL